MSNQYRSVLASSGPAPTGGDAVAANVLAGKTFTNDNGFDTGTMVNNGAVSQTLNAGQSYTIPEGYHNGSGTVTAAAREPYVYTALSGTQSVTFDAEIGDIVVWYDGNPSVPSGFTTKTITSGSTGNIAVLECSTAGSYTFTNSNVSGVSGYVVHP